MDELHKLFNKYKNNNVKPVKDILKLHDISLDLVIPSDLFNAEITNIKTIVKSNFKVQSEEKFYGNGIISNTFFNLEFNDFAKYCDYDWLLSFAVFMQYFKIDNESVESNSKLELVKSHNIKLFVMGPGNGGFITGLHYFINNSSMAEKNILKNYEINWFAMDYNEKKVAKFDKILNKFNFKDNILHGFVNDDLSNTNNLMYVESMLNNKFTNSNVIFNNIKPRMKNNKSKIMVSLAYLTLSTLSKSGLMITKILEPEYWDTCFINYLLLFALIFNKTEIFRFPICKGKKGKKGKTTFKYYLVGSFRKTFLYNTLLCKKIIYILNTDQTIHFPDLDIAEWKKKIHDIQSNYYIAENPNDAIYGIIKDLTEFI